MKQIINDKNHTNYISNNLIGKYIYYKEERDNEYLYFIFTIESIKPNESNKLIIYNTNKCYLLYVPKNITSKCFIYDNYNQINILANNDLYEMTFSEFVNTFREFIKIDGKVVSDLPTKIIQDESI